MGLSGVQRLLEQVHSGGSWNLVLLVEVSPLGAVLLTVARVSHKVLHSRHDSSEKHILQSRNFIPIVETPSVGEFNLLNFFVFTLVSTTESPRVRKMVSLAW